MSWNPHSWVIFVQIQRDITSLGLFHEITTSKFISWSVSNSTTLLVNGFTVWKIFAVMSYTDVPSRKSFLDVKIFHTFCTGIFVDSWKFSILLLYILWDDWIIFMISRSNEQIQQQLEYTLQKPDCHSWLLSKV